MRSCNRTFLEDDNRCVPILDLRGHIYIRGYFSADIFLLNSRVAAPGEIPFIHGFLRSLSGGRKKIDDILIRREKQNHLWEATCNRDSRRFCKRRKILSYRKTRFHVNRRNRRNLSWISISDTRHNCLARKRKRALVLSRKWDKLLINCPSS